MAHPELPPQVAAALEKADGEALHALAQSADKDLRKGAKRALHLLKAKGIVVAEPLKADAPREPAFAPEPQREAARLTTYDPNGELLFFFPFKATMGFTLLVGVVSDGGLLLDLRELTLSRKQLRSYFQQLPERLHEVLFDVTDAQLAAAILPALESHEGPLRQRAHELAARLPRNVPAPTSTAEPSALASSAALFETAPFVEALPDPAVIADLERKLQEIAVSPLYVDERQKTEQVRRTFDRVTADYFTDEKRKRFARRAEIAAWLFDSKGNVEAAAQARSVAAALLDSGDVLAIPFARALFDTLLAGQAGQKTEPLAKDPDDERANLILAP